MMRKHKLLLLLLLSIITSCDKCKKKEDPPPKIDTTVLPPATTTGENTMGCLVNGEVWLPLKENFLGNLVYDVSFEVTPLSQGGGVFISSIRSFDNQTASLIFSAENADSIGVFYLPTWSLNNIYINQNCGSFHLDTTYINQVNITRLDYNNQIVSGQFEMRVVNEVCDTIIITEGRFDLSGN